MNEAAIEEYEGEANEAEMTLESAEAALDE